MAKIGEALSAIALTILLTVPVNAEPALILDSLPTPLQKKIQEVRASCVEKTVAGDDGLSLFTISGARAVLVDQLQLCGDGICNHGSTCATGYTHWVEIYVRYGNAWRNALSVDATEPIFLSIEPYNDTFRALVLSVHGGDKGCPIRNKHDPTAWKREKCDFVIKWVDGKFVWKPL
jgi:hypothetical protein